MSTSALIVASICYFLAAISNAKERDYSHAVMFFAYTVANLALLHYEFKKME